MMGMEGVELEECVPQESVCECTQVCIHKCACVCVKRGPVRGKN